MRRETSRFALLLNFFLEGKWMEKCHLRYELRQTSMRRETSRFALSLVSFLKENREGCEWKWIEKNVLDLNKRCWTKFVREYFEGYFIDSYEDESKECLAFE